MGQFHRIEVLPLHVLDNGEFEAIGRRDIRDHGGQGRLIRELTGAESSFAHDELITIARPSNDNRLKHSVLANGICQAAKGCFVKFPSRLIWIRIDQSDIELYTPRVRGI
jgi:hypothetical protein